MCDYGVIQLSLDALRKIDSHIIDTAFVAYRNDRLWRDGRDDGGR